MSGRVTGGHAQHPGLQELALAGAGGAADQRMWPLRAQIQSERLAGRLSDHGSQAGGLAPNGQRRPTGDDRFGLLPPFQHCARIFREVGPEERKERDGARKIGFVGHPGAGVGDRRQGAGGQHGGRWVDGLADHGRDTQRGRDETGCGLARPGIDADVGAAGRREFLLRRCHPEHVHPGRRSALGDSDEAVSVDGAIVLHDDQQGRQLLDRPLWGGQSLLDQFFDFGGQPGTGTGFVGEMQTGQRRIGRAVVRQPFQPVPLAATVAGRERRHGEVGR